MRLAVITSYSIHYTKLYDTLLDWLAIATPGTDLPGRVLSSGGAEHQVTGQRRLNGDLRRFHVAHFTHHDDVRVLTEEGAERLAEGQVVEAHLTLRQHEGEARGAEQGVV